MTHHLGHLHLHMLSHRISFPLFGWSIACLDFSFQWLKFSQWPTALPVISNRLLNLYLIALHFHRLCTTTKKSKFLPVLWIFENNSLKIAIIIRHHAKATSYFLLGLGDLKEENYSVCSSLFQCENARGSYLVSPLRSDCPMRLTTMLFLLQPYTGRTWKAQQAQTLDHLSCDQDFCS